MDMTLGPGRRRAAHAGEPLRVAYVHSFRELGGAERSLELLVRAAGDAVRSLVYVRAGAKAYDFLRARGVPVVPYEPAIFAARRPRDFWAYSARWAADLRRRRVQLVHVNGDLPLRHCWLAALLAGCPLVVHIRCLFRHTAENWRRRNWFELAAADEVIWISATARRSWQAVAPQLRGITIPNAVDLAAFRPHRPATAVRAELGVPAGALLAGVVANFNQEVKRHELVIDAAEALAAEDVHFVIVGAPAPWLESDRRFRERLGQSPARERIHLAGWTDNVADYLNAVDVLFHPGVDEAFGRTLIEAMSLGKPVVAADSGACAEVVADGTTGLLFAPHDMTAMVDRLRRVTSDGDLRARLGRAGTARVAELFTAPAHVRAVLGVYRRLLRRTAADRAVRGALRLLRTAPAARTGQRL